MLARPELASYAVFVTVVSACAALGYAVMEVCAPRPGDSLSRWALLAVLVVLGAWWVVSIVVAIPWAPVVLALLVALAWTSLRRLEGRATDEGAGDVEAAPDHVLGWTPGIPPRSLAPLLAVPAVAWATYAGLSPLATGEAGSGTFYVGFVALVGILTVAGTIALVWSLWRAWGPRSRRAREQQVADAGT